MPRRTILLIVAVVIAALGATLVFLYVQGVEKKADEAREVVKVLGATDVISAGETADDALSSGKIDYIEVPRENLIDGAIDQSAPLTGLVALTTIYPGEQIVPQKFGASGTQSTITIPDGMMAISVQLDDPSRVAGYVTPGAQVAIFMTGKPELIDSRGNSQVLPEFTQLLFPKVEVIGVGSTTLLTSTTTDESGAQTTEQLPRTLLTLAVTQAQAERIIYASKHGDLTFGLLTEKSVVKPAGPLTAEQLFK